VSDCSQPSLDQPSPLRSTIIADDKANRAGRVKNSLRSIFLLEFYLIEY
jgi:hypothetical protein